MSSSKYLTSMIELTCHIIIMMKSDEINHPDDGNNRSDDMAKKEATIEMLWEKRMHKINFDLGYLWRQIELRMDRNADSSWDVDMSVNVGGRLYSYSVIVEYLRNMYLTFYNLIHTRDREGNDSKNDDTDLDAQKWKQLSDGLEQLRLLFMNPNSTILILPKHRVDDFDIDYDSDEDDNNEEAISMNQDSANDGNDDDKQRESTSTPSKKNTSPSRSSCRSDISHSKKMKNLETKLRPFTTDYEKIRMKLSLQQCFQCIRKDILHALSDNNKNVQFVPEHGKIFHQLINDGRFEDFSDVYSILSSLFEAPTQEISSPNTYRMTSDALEIIKKHEHLFSGKLLLQEMEELIQNWYNVCFPTPEIHPEKFTKYSLLQSEMKMKISALLPTIENEDIRQNDNPRKKEQRKRKPATETKGDDKHDNKAPKTRYDSMDAVRNLEAKRIQLKRNVKDPLQEIHAKASTAMPAPNSIVNSSVDISVSDDPKKMHMNQSYIEKEDSSYHRKNEGKEDEGNQRIETKKNTTANEEQQISPSKHQINTPHLYRKKKTARQEKFDDSDESLSFIGSPSPPAQRRGKYSMEEKEAIKRGYMKYGNQWARIIGEFPVLNGRCNVSVKDCFRNMKNMHEI